MALLGLSIIVASVILFCMRRPAWLPSIFGGSWRTPPGLPPSEQPGEERKTDHHPVGNGCSTKVEPSDNDSHGPEIHTDQPAPAPQQAADGTAMPLPPVPVILREAADADADGASLVSSSTDSQTTPKASPAALTTPVPSLALAADKPSPINSSEPSSSSPPSSSSSSSSSLMPPPPRPASTLRPPPSGLSPFNRNRANLPLPPRGVSGPQQPQPQQQQYHQRPQQPGCSTLAPPPSHSAKPSKPSRAVSLTPGHSPLDWARLSSGAAADDLRGLPPGTPYLRVTRTMLSRQTGRKGKDAWTVLGGRVYNITPYLPFHPGGEPELLRGAGRDGTRLFGEVHPWVNYETMLAACLVGIYVGNEEEEEGGAMEAMD